jgi:hypothetical protein
MRLGWSWVFANDRVLPGRVARRVPRAPFDVWFSTILTGAVVLVPLSHVSHPSSS